MLNTISHMDIQKIQLKIMFRIGKIKHFQIVKKKKRTEGEIKRKMINGGGNEGVKLCVWGNRFLASKDSKDLQGKRTSLQMVLESKVLNESPFKGKKTQVRCGLGMMDELEWRRRLLGMRKPTEVGWRIKKLDHRISILHTAWHNQSVFTEVG